MSERHHGGLISLENYHRPSHCALCGGIMIFKGVGEYECEDCKYRDYDDYGKVRLYIEQHRGATAVEVEKATGVSQKTIRQMLHEGRIEVAADSKAFLHCEICGADIRSGRYCSKCMTSANRKFEEEVRNKKKMQGFGASIQGESGAKRFIRKEQ